MKKKKKQSGFSLIEIMIVIVIIAIMAGAVSIASAVAEVNPYLCKGCGTCAAACPDKAMTLIHFDDWQLVSEIIGALG